MDKKPVFQFAVGQDILCYYNNILYSAKCLKICLMENKPKYFVHYKGFNSRWDDWLDEDYILVKNLINILHMKRCRELLNIKKGKLIDQTQKDKKKLCIKKRKAKNKNILKVKFVKCTQSQLKKELCPVSTSVEISKTKENTSSLKHGICETIPEASQLNENKKNGLNSSKPNGIIIQN